MNNDEVPCNPHPDAPHGFDRTMSHTLGRYVCDCEGWEPDEDNPPVPDWSEHGFVEEKAMTHHDDKFRNTDCPKCEEYRIRIDFLIQVCVEYREQIKRYQEEQLKEAEK